jgi:copper chaperone CopZ
MTTTTTLAIEGMTCGGCAASVERSLKALDGVSACTVNLAAGTAEVVHDDALAVQDLVARVEDAGFEARAGS